MLAESILDGLKTVTIVKNYQQVFLSSKLRVKSNSNSSLWWRNIIISSIIFTFIPADQSAFSRFQSIPASDGRVFLPLLFPGWRYSTS